MKIFSYFPSKANSLVVLNFIFKGRTYEFIMHINPNILIRLLNSPSLQECFEVLYKAMK